MHSADGRAERRNFLLNLAEGSLFIAGASFISAQTVLPALVVRLGGGNLAVGAVGAVTWMGLFLPQVFAARWAQSIPWKKPWALWFGGTQRLLVLAAGVAVFTFGEEAYPAGLTALFIAYGLMQVVTAVSTPGWFDLFAKLTPVRLRGRLAGLRNALGGGLAALCALGLAWMLASFPFPLNYALAFFAAFLLQAASVLLQFWYDERAPSPVVPLAPVREFLQQIGRALGRTGGFRTFLGASGLMILAGVPTGFITVHALRDLGADDATVGGFTALLMVVQVVSAPLIGLLADRMGNRVVLVVAAASLCAASITAMLAASTAVLGIAFVFVGITLGSEIMARHNMAVEFAPQAERALYIGLMNSLLAPLYLLGLAGGLVADTFGFRALFLLGAVAAAVACALLLLVVHEPRTGPA